MATVNLVPGQTVRELRGSLADLTAVEDDGELHLQFSLKKLLT